MANEFKIVISAVDRATASVRRINDSISRITRPVADVRRSIGGLGREMGLNKVTASFDKVAASAKGVANSARSIAAPIAAAVGIGSIAGIAAMANEWGRMGMEVSNTSRSLGLATSDLQSLRGAANLAGVSSESLTGGMESLGATINDAKWGRNQGALALMSRLGMGFHQTQDGSVNTVRSLHDLSAAMMKIKDVQTQHKVAREFGVDALFPLLIKGPKALDEAQKKIAGLGGIQSAASIRSAEQFGLQLNYLKAATEGLKFSIADSLMPVLSPLIEQTTNWIAKNRELIAGKVANFVQGIATWLSKVNFSNVLKGVTDTANAVGKAVDAFGGWKNVIGAVVGLNVVSSLAPLISLGVALGGVGAALGGIGAGLAAFAASAAGLAVLAAVAGYAGYKGAEYLFGKKPANNGGIAGPAMHLRSKADLRATVDQQRADAGLPPLPIRQPMSYAESAQEARMLRTQNLGLPRDLSLAPLGIRSNNPLNLMPHGKEAVFPSMETGIAAALKNLQRKRYFGGGNDTVAGIVNAWSPPNVKNNSVEKNANYIEGVEHAVGTGHLDSSNPQTMAKLLSAMIYQENGKGYDKQKMEEAVQHTVMVEFKNAPPGISASTTSSNNKMPTPVRVVTSMPMTGAP